MTTLIPAIFCVALVTSGAKTQRAEIEEEATSTTLATTTKSPVTGNTFIPAVRNVTTTKTSEEETTLSTTTTATTGQTSLLTTSQSSMSTTTFSLLAESSILESTTNPPSLAADVQQTSRRSPGPATSLPVFVVDPNKRHPNTVSTGNNNYAGKNDVFNLVNTVGFRKHIYNQMYQRLQQEQEEYMQSLLFSGLLFDI